MNRPGPVSFVRASRGPGRPADLAVSLPASFDGLAAALPWPWRRVRVDARLRGTPLDQVVNFETAPGRAREVAKMKLHRLGFTAAHLVLLLACGSGAWAGS